MAAIAHRPEAIGSALAAFANQPIREAAISFLAALGYRSDRTLKLGNSSPKSFLDSIKPHSSGTSFNETKALFADWATADLLFQITDEELSGNASLFKETGVNTGLLRSYLFFAIELTGGDYPRGQLTGIARQINRLFPMPVMVLIKHLKDKKPVLSIAVINRRQNKRDAARDVLGKVTIIRDISLGQPHRGHLDILASFAVPNLVHPQRLPINNFDTLHAAWEEIFNVELLNQRFYRELANWYFWALPQVEFPNDTEKDDDKRRATSLIRLLTRLIFCWFLKEKGLIPEKLFVEAELRRILVDLGPGDCTYHQAILQNLFFATLNQRMGKDKNGQPYRAFAKDEGFQKNRATYGVDTLYRYGEHFRDAATALELFADVPFLNGGLFECLDRIEDGTNRKLYLDGFSRNKKKRPTVPNRLFFAEEQTADLSDAYGEPKRRNEKVRGLLRILHSYKFTIVENTPIDQEIALDPELLGKVFENLLASYNEETKTTARKQTGSFYTPRPIVEYMVDESLKAHLTGALAKTGMSEADAQAGLDILFAYTERNHPFHERETAALLDAIHTCKILDPACGSGAFPMGMLHKLVYIIHKLDPDNARWKKLQIDAASQIPDSTAREAAIAAIERDFVDNEDDYGRKLYLIENCLYGVDIQPIAIQISKLRFFISLVCDQRTSRSKKENHGIRPLPNLETKFVAANALVGLPEMEQRSLVPQRVYKIEAEIEALYHSHFSIQRRDQKLSLQHKIKGLRKELGRLLAESLMAPKKAQHVAAWDPFDPQSSSEFFEPHWMYGRSLAAGFDIVIGNPPYFKENDSKARFEGLRERACYQGKMDVWYLFADVGLDILKEGGVLAFIATNNWITNAGASKLRNKILRHATLISLIDFQDFMIFESASIQTMIMILQKRQDPLKYNATISKALPEFSRENVYHLNSKADSDTSRLTTFQVEIDRHALLDKPLHFNPEANISILELIKAAGGFLLSKSEIAQGIVPNPDRVNSRNIKSIGAQAAQNRGIKVGDGVFVLGQSERTGIKEPERIYLKPLYEPVHFDKYFKRPTDLSIIYSKKGSFDPARAPSIVAHLRKFKEIMDERRENQTGQIAFYNLHWPRDESFFQSGGKILTPRKCATPIFFYTEDVAYVMLSMNVIRTTRLDLRYLSAVLNSSTVKYWLRLKGSKQGSNYQIDAAPLQQIPIAKGTQKQQDVLATLVTLAQTAYAQNSLQPSAASQFLEDLIDACVMECYFHQHMAERRLTLLENVAPHLVAYSSKDSNAKQREFLDQFFRRLNAPSSIVRNCLLRLTAESPELLAVIKEADKE